MSSEDLSGVSSECKSGHSVPIVMSKKDNCAWLLYQNNSSAYLFLLQKHYYSC